jgi:hypothetical protein
MDIASESPASALENNTGLVPGTKSLLRTKYPHHLIDGLTCPRGTLNRELTVSR